MLFDEVGIDIGFKIVFIFEKELGECFKVLDVFNCLIDFKCLGCKIGCGFYFYDKKDKKVDELVYELLGVMLLFCLNKSEIVKCCVV